MFDYATAIRSVVPVVRLRRGNGCLMPCLRRGRANLRSCPAVPIRTNPARTRAARFVVCFIDRLLAIAQAQAASASSSVPIILTTILIVAARVSDTETRRNSRRRREAAPVCCAIAATRRATASTSRLQGSVDDEKLPAVEPRSGDGPFAVRTLPAPADRRRGRHSIAFPGAQESGTPKIRNTLDVGGRAESTNRRAARDEFAPNVSQIRSVGISRPTPDARDREAERSGPTSGNDAGISAPPDPLELPATAHAAVRSRPVAVPRRQRPAGREPIPDQGRNSADSAPRCLTPSAFLSIGRESRSARKSPFQRPPGRYGAPGRTVSPSRTSPPRTSRRCADGSG